MADYRETRALMKDFGLRGHWGNAALIREALNRGVAVSVAKRRPRIVFSHGGQEYRW